jgi:hypothetical protein
VVEFRRRALLPLDDVLGCLRDAVPRLTRSALHRRLVRRGIPRLPRGEGNVPERRRSAETAIGHVHVCELRLAEGRPHVLLAIDRVSKFAHVASHDADTELSGAAFLRGVVQAFPCAIRTVPTDDGMALAGLPRYRDGPTARRTGHIFDRVCRERGIEHELTRPYRPWANGRAERTNRTAKEAAVKALHHPDPEALRGPRPGLRHRPRLRQAPQGAALAHTLPGRLRRLEGRPFSLRDRPAPPHPGTAHLAGARRRRRRRRAGQSTSGRLPAALPRRVAAAPPLGPGRGALDDRTAAVAGPRRTGRGRPWRARPVRRPAAALRGPRHRQRRPATARAPMSADIARGPLWPGAGRAWEPWARAGRGRVGGVTQDRALAATR